MTTQIQDLRTTDSILLDIYTSLSHNKWNDLFDLGWKTLKEKSSPNTFTAYKTTLVVGGVLATPFILGSATFGCLAMAEGIHEISAYGKAPIIGHFSEWTMQAVMATAVVCGIVFQIANLGFQEKINRVFDAPIQDTTLKRNIRVSLYKDKLEFQKTRTHNTLFVVPDLPHISNPDEVDKDIIATDARLDSLYREIEKDLNVSAGKLIQMGYNEVLKKKSKLYQTALISSLVGACALLAIQYSIYGLGIYWSADQAINDGIEGANPSIGGHCLEWFAEMLAVGNLAYSWFSGLANVGSVRHTVDVFNAKIAKIEITKDKLRLREVRDLQINQISQGAFFSLPYSLKYE